MGLLDHLSDLFEFHRCHGKKKLSKLRKRQLEMVEIRVKMDCEGCERRVRKWVDGMKGVTNVEVEPKKQRLVVTGYVDPDKVLRRVRHRTGKKAEFWPYVPYNLVDHPYVRGVYDKKAPAGFVRNVDGNPQASTLARASSTEVNYITAFIDENARIMIPTKTQ